jgi:hypothetical protein
MIYLWHKAGRNGVRNRFLAAASVMVTNPNPPNWQTIPHNYITIDLDDLRVRQ